MTDPAGLGGTGFLTYPDGTQQALNYTGSGQTFKLIYPVTDPYGTILTFDAQVTNSAGVASPIITATADVIAGGLEVAVVPTKPTIYPWIHNSRESYFPGKYSTPVDIQVKKVLDKSPVVASQVNATVKMVAGTEAYGGHDHGQSDGANKPTGSMLPASGTTDANGNLAATYLSSEFSGQDEVVAEASFQGCTGTSLPVTITSKIPGLVPMTLPAGGAHQFVGGTCEHFGAFTPWDNQKTAACGGASGASNVYISSAIQGTFDKLLNEYSRLYPGVGLYINDASLKFGGKFDVNGGWSTTDSHSVHRLGFDVDFALKDTSAPIGTPTLHRNVEKRLKDLFKANPDIRDSLSNQLHPTPANPDHIHIWFIR